MIPPMRGDIFEWPFIKHPEPIPNPDPHQEADQDDPDNIVDDFPCT